MGEKMKGVILAGGFGTRLRPFTKRMNKGMAPIYTKDGAIPQILFPLNTLINGGIDDIMIITSREHCGQLVELLGDGEEYKCKLTYRIQEMNRPVVGIAQALGLSEDFAGNAPSFAVILGDNFYEDNLKDVFFAFNEEAKTSRFSSNPNDFKAHIFLKEVHDPERFGVASLDENKKVTKIIEKPAKPETNFAVTGLYLYTSWVFNQLPHLKPSKRNELEITDINQSYVAAGSMQSTILTGWWHDMGTPEAARETENHIWNTYAKIQK